MYGWSEEYHKKANIHLDSCFDSCFQLIFSRIMHVLLDTSADMLTQSRSTDMVTKSQPTYRLSIGQ